MKANVLLMVGLVWALSGCRGEEEKADAYGHFEADEVRISAQVAGPLLTLEVEEGQRVAAGELVAVVDTTPAFLQKEQIEASMRALHGKLKDPEPDVAVLLQQQEVLERERDRLRHLVSGKAATQKQLDDLEGQLAVIEKQIAAARTRAAQANRAILSELEPLRARLRQVNDQMRRCRIFSPVAGRVLSKLVEKGEVVAPGRPLCIVAPMDTLVLRAYVSEPQLAQLQLGQQVHVLVDGLAGAHHLYRGTVSWIADEAEFTPKVVQTREERVHLVYAIKVRVPNDGRLKIGMPAELWLAPPPSATASDIHHQDS